MKRLAILMAAGLTLGLTACGSGDTVNTTSCLAKPFNDAAVPVIPPCTVPVNFSVDDSTNQVFQAGELLWKGSFQYDAVTRIAYRDGDWNAGNGPHVPLYDDGPWNGWTDNSVTPAVTRYGHEPIGAVAGDHIWGATVFVPNNEAASVTYEYGLIDHAFNDGWIWRGPNGSFSVAPGATAAITAPGLEMLPFGDNDVKLTLDVNALETVCGQTTDVPPAPIPCTWATNGKIQVKGSAWAWVDIELFDDGLLGDEAAGDGIYTFVLSEYAGAGKQLYHTGLAYPGDQVQFVFAFGTGDTYKEYKVGKPAQTEGVAAAVMAAGSGTWTTQAVVNQATGDENTYITVP